MSVDPWDTPCTCPLVTDEAGQRIHLLACADHPAARSIHDEELTAFRERTLPEWVRRAQQRALPSSIRSSWE